MRRFTDYDFANATASGLVIGCLLAAAYLHAGEPQLRFEPAPAPAKKPTAPPAIPLNSTGLEKPSNKDVPPPQRVTPKLDSKPDTPSIKPVPVPPPQFQPPRDDAKSNRLEVQPRKIAPLPNRLAQQVRPVVKFHHCRKECKPCPKAYSWMWHLGPKSINATIVFMEYENPNEAGANGVPFVPSLELNGNFIGFDPDHKNHKKHGKNACCPVCVNDWIKRGGKTWPPENVEFDEPAADQRVAAAGFGLVLKPVVAVFLPLAKAVLGRGTLAVVWHRPNGAEVFPIWRGGPGDYSPTAIGGATGGHIRFSGKDTNLPKLLREYGAGYSISGDDITFYPDPLTVSLRGAAPGSSASQPVGFPVPSLIFGGLNLLFKALSVKAELQLGKDVEVTASMPADVLIVEVRKGPILHAYVGFDRYASVTRIEVGASSGTVFTPGAWPIPKRQTINF